MVDDALILAVLTRLDRTLEKLEAHQEHKERRRNLDSRLLTKRAAARLLGIDRSTTLERLIREGSVRTVPYGEGTRIPASEIARLEDEGIPEPSSRCPPRRRSRKRLNGETMPSTPEELAARIRSIKTD